MIAPLRRRHRLMIALIAPVVLVFFVLALKARPPLPVVDEPPTALIPPMSGSGGVLFESPKLFSQPDIQGRIRAATTGMQLELEPAEPFRLPSVLIYWTRSPNPPSTADLASAQLLGTLTDTRAQVFSLPEGLSGGHLALYSLGHQEIVATAELPLLAGAGAPLAATDAPALSEPEGAQPRNEDSEAEKGFGEPGSAEGQG